MYGEYTENEKYQDRKNCQQIFEVTQLRDGDLIKIGRNTMKKLNINI